MTIHMVTFLFHLQEIGDLQVKVRELESAAVAKAADFDAANQQADITQKSLQAETSAVQKKLREAEQANARATSDHAAQKGKLDAKIQNQRQVTSAEKRLYNPQCYMNAWLNKLLTVKVMLAAHLGQEPFWG